MSTHFLGLEEARTLRTPDFEIAAVIVEHVTALHGIGLIYGPAGVGKTFAVDSAIDAHPGPVYRFDFPPRVTPKQLIATLLHTVCGVRPDRATHAELYAELIDVLADTAPLFKVDETQRLDYMCFETLRGLWDRNDNDLALLLVGGHRCWETISRYPMLHSRICGSREFQPLTRTEVRELIPQLHPIYEDIDPALIDRIDHKAACGNLRNWVNITAALVRLKEHAGPEDADRELVDLALDLLPTIAP